MSINLKYIEPNKWYHKLYNNYCLRLLRKKQELKTDAKGKVSSLSPVFVTGFFRSGTSFTNRILETLGMNLGPTEHLLMGVKKRADLNPDGFYENYLFMETSLLAFHKLNAWGHLPPTPKAVAELSFDENDRQIFPEFTLCGVHDDRISNANKIEIIKKYDILSLDTYLENNFKNPFSLKNPHFAVLSSFLLKKWPNARFLVCFREPSAAIASASKITPLLTEEIYHRYYSELLELEKGKVVFFSFDHLLLNPQFSINQLADNFNLDKKEVSTAVNLINPKLHRFKNKTEPQTQAVRELYNELLKRAINIQA